MLFHALGADAVAEPGIGMPADISLHLIPVTQVVADLLAEGADGKDALECVASSSATSIFI